MFENTQSQPNVQDASSLAPNKKRQRIWEIDFLRGACVVLMILDHLALLVGNYFGAKWYGRGFYYAGLGDAFTRFCYSWWFGAHSGARDIAHTIVLFVFFSISGISCTLSRNNAKRGFQLLIVALVYSLGSYIGEEFLGISGILVTFGVLNFLAVSMLLYALVEFLCKRNRWLIILSSAVLITLTLCLYFLYTPPATTPKIFAIIFPDKDFWGNPSLFYTQGEISPGDMFSMIPWTAFYFTGAILGQLLYRNKKSLFSKSPVDMCFGMAKTAVDNQLETNPQKAFKWAVPMLKVLVFAQNSYKTIKNCIKKPVCFVGKHALIVYVVHVVALAVLLCLISGIFITPGEFLL